MTDIKEYTKYVYIALILGFIYLGYLIIKPFVMAIITSAILVYIFYPWYRWLYKRIKRKNLAALIITILVITLITVPLIFVLNAITREAYIFYIVSKQKIVTGNLLETKCFDDGFLCRSIESLKEKLSSPKMMFYMESGIKKLTSYILDNASKIPTKLANIAINLFITIFVMFFLFRDGEDGAKRLTDFVPIKRFHKKYILKKFNDVIYAIIYGSIFAAVIQGAVGAFGFYIFGVPSPLLWGLVMVVAALVPLIGTPIIWLPAGLFLIASGYLNGNSIIIAKGIGLLLYGAFIISNIDNFLKPKIIGDRAKIHPVLVLLGVLGGLRVFGLIGFVIGPLILAFCVILPKIYKKEIS